MLIRIISDYLRSNKRLVIPQLGCFLVKEPDGTVVFSELLRRDDGVLRGLLVGQGMNELAAAGEIDRFVFEVRHALEQGDPVVLPGLGLWRPGPQGTIRFEHRPEASKAPAVPAAGVSPSRPAATARPVPAAPHPAPRPAETPRPEAAAEQSEAPVSQPGPEPETEPERDRRPEPGHNRPKPRRAEGLPAAGRPAQRKPDRFLLIGIAALLIALAAIAYGYYHDRQEQREADRLIEQFEQAAASAAEAAEAE